MSGPMMVECEPVTSPAHLSPSSISTWMQCPLRFKYSRIDRIPEPSTSAQLLGSFTHEVLEHLYMLPAADRTIATARRLTGDLWNNKWAAEVEVLNLSDKELHAFRWQTWWCVEALFAMENPQETELDGIEHKVDLHIGDVKLLGIIDRWNRLPDGGAIISDYKTGKKPRPQYEGEKKLQLTVYAELAEAVLNVEVRKTELLYLKEQVRWEYVPTAQDRERMRETVQSVWADIQDSCTSGTFTASTSILCNWCHYKSMCPAWVK